MLQAQLCDESDSEEVLQPLQTNQIIFQFPPKNFQYKVWSSRKDLFEDLWKRTLELGFFQGRIFISTTINDKQICIMKCKKCALQLTIYSEQDGRSHFQKFQNLHVHDINEHQPQFYELLTFFQEHPFLQNLDKLVPLFNFYKTRARKIQDLYYMKFVNFQTMINRLNIERNFNIKTWKSAVKKQETGEKYPDQQIYMLLMVTQTMVEAYLKDHRAISFDIIPKVSQLKCFQKLPKYWLVVTFTTFDNNNRLILLGVGLIAHNSKRYYNNRYVLRDLLQNFLERVNNQPPDVIISNQNRSMCEAIQLVKQRYNFNWTHIIGWPYKLKEIKNDLKQLCYYNEQQISKLLYLYAELLRQPQEHVFEIVVQRITNMSKQSLILYNFLTQYEKYCFSAIETKYCGFLPSISKTEVYRNMRYHFTQQQNFYKYFLKIAKYQRILQKRVKIFDVAARQRNFMLELGLKVILTSMDNVMYYRRPNQQYKEKLLQKKISAKIIQNYHLHKSHNYEQVKPKYYEVTDIKSQRVLSIIHHNQSIDRWVCSCTYSIKLGKLMEKYLVKYLKEWIKRNCKRQFFCSRSEMRSGTHQVFDEMVKNKQKNSNYGST